MYEKVGDKIKVLAVFEGGAVIPKIFKWKDRTYKIKNVNLAYQEREGRSINYYYSVDCLDGGVFKLCYNDEKLTWTIEEFWVD